jgi:hypothetical protein
MKGADHGRPGRIDCYEVVKRSATGAAFKLDPARLVYSLRWKHNAVPPDFDLVLVQEEPQGWVNTANLTLLGELRRRGTARDRLGGADGRGHSADARRLRGCAGSHRAPALTRHLRLKERTTMERTDRGVDHKCVPPCGAPTMQFPPPESWLGPFISSLSPDHGPAAGGKSVVITGRNFTGATAVMFGANAATSFTVNSDTEIVAVSPPQA